MKGGSYENDRGMSKVLGVTLLVAISLSAALVVMATGQDTIDELSGEQDEQVAEDTIREIDTLFGSFARGPNNTGSRSVTVPEDLDGEFTVENDTVYRIRLNGQAKCDTGEQPMGTLVYDREDGVVGYEGGGIWEQSGVGASMRSPPGITYERGGLNVQFPNVSGRAAGASELSASSNVTREVERGRNLSLALYTNLSYGETGRFDVVCDPSGVRNATIWINGSSFAPAWKRYAERNYDDRRVQVGPSGQVSPGDNVSMTFLLGDVSEPVFNVTTMDVSRDSSSDPLWVNATVRNEGGLDASMPVEFRLEGSATTVASDTRTATIDGGNETQMNFSVPASTVNGLASGDYTATVETMNDTRSETIEFTGSTTGDFQVVSVTAPDRANPDDDETVTVDVENVGGMTERQTVSFEFNGTTLSAETVRLDPGETATLTFELPTQWDGIHNWQVATEDDTAQDAFRVGTVPYFEITTVNADSSLGTGTTFNLDATVENTGDLNDTQTVELRVEDVSTGAVETSTTASVSLNGTLVAGSDSETESLSWTPSTAGTYRYVVETENQSTSGTFAVDSPDVPNFAVQSIEPSKNPGPLGEQVTFNVTVANTGDAVDTQTVSLTTGGGVTFWTQSITLTPGASQEISQQVTLDESDFSTGLITLEASTDNGTLSQSYPIEEPENINDSDGVIVVDEEVRAQVEVLGAELEGQGSDWGDYYIINNPTVMSLYIDNDSGTYTRDLWTEQHGGDVNNPHAEQAILNESTPNPYNESFTLEPNSSVSLHSRSYYCDDYDPTDVVWEDLIQGGYDAVGYECVNWGSEWIEITDTENSDNVVILSDGEEVPALDQASAYQRGVDDMLAGHMEANGTLDLSPNERVFMYELSEYNADPDDAEGSGDPDYNDAVALFSVIEINETVAAPPRFRITDIDAPSQILRNDDVEIQVTVKNVGGQTGDTGAQLSFAGASVDDNDAVTDVDPNETATLTLEPDTDEPEGTYNFDVTLTSDPNVTRSGQITIGTPPNPAFQVSDVDAPAVAHVGDSQEVEATIENTGGSGDTQQVRLVDADTGSVEESTSVTLSSGADETVQFDLPAGSTGTFDYYIETENATTSTLTLFVGDSDVEIRSLDIATRSYDESDDLIERRSVENMRFEVRNVGDVGADREVTLEVRNRNSGSVVYDNTSTVQVGEGRLSGEFPAWISEDVELDPGYYNYTVTVSDGGTTEDSWTGELYIHEDAEVSDDDDSDSPISVDTDEISIDG